jgi:hypothetical protein
MSLLSLQCHDAVIPLCANTRRSHGVSSSMTEAAAAEEQQEEVSRNFAKLHGRDVDTSTLQRPPHRRRRSFSLLPSIIEEHSRVPDRQRTSQQSQPQPQPLQQQQQQVLSNRGHPTSRRTNSIGSIIVQSSVQGQSRHSLHDAAPSAQANRQHTADEDDVHSIFRVGANYARQRAGHCDAREGYTKEPCAQEEEEEEERSE